MLLTIAERPTGTNTTTDMPVSKFAVYLMTKDNRRLYAEFSGWNRPVYRNTNKRTGMPLKKTVLDHWEVNQLYIDFYFHQYEYQKTFYRFSYTGIYEACYGGNEENRQIATGKHYTKEDCLKAIYELTGVLYEGFSVVPYINGGTYETPDWWYKAAENEKAQCRYDLLEMLEEKASQEVNSILRAGRDPKFYLPRFVDAFDQIAGTTKKEKDAAIEIIKKSGGYREKTILNNPNTIIYKYQNDNDYKVIRITNLSQNCHCAVELNSGIICG